MITGCAVMEEQLCIVATVNICIVSVKKSGGCPYNQYSLIMDLNYRLHFSVTLELMNFILVSHGKNSLCQITSVIVLKRSGSNSSRSAAKAVYQTLNGAR